MRQIIKYLLILQMVFVQIANGQDAKNLIREVVEANGGIEALRALKDVSFEYTFKSVEKNSADVSIERYIFDGEASYAKYIKRKQLVLPQMKGKLTQFFDGQKAISKLDNTVLTEQQPAFMGHALRKTNFYWFNMMFKLLDPGVIHKLLPERKVNGISYKIVEMTFGENIGESSDRYILYINPKTKRVDQFLFTAVGFGVTTPKLMQVQYEQISGVYLTTYRKYASADWDGNIIKEDWTEQISKNIKFGNGFDLKNIDN